MHSNNAPGAYLTRTFFQIINGPGPYARGGGGGVLAYLAERGCAALMGHFFYKKSLNMGPVFYPKNP